jgi:hypothetical protein
MPADHAGQLKSVQRPNTVDSRPGRGWQDPNGLASGSDSRSRRPAVREARLAEHTKPTAKRILGPAEQLARPRVRVCAAATTHMRVGKSRADVAPQRVRASNIEDRAHPDGFISHVEPAGARLAECAIQSECRGTRDRNEHARTMQPDYQRNMIRALRGQRHREQKVRQDPANPRCARGRTDAVRNYFSRTHRSTRNPCGARERRVNESP